MPSRESRCAPGTTSTAGTPGATSTTETETARPAATQRCTAAGRTSIPVGRGAPWYRRFYVWLSFAVAIASQPLAVGVARAGDHVDGELALEQRMVAPCCWVQTLDMHDSPVAKQLREEIHLRLLHGDSATNIEADLVRRYGGRIIAMPASNPLGKVAAVVSGIVLIAGVLLLRLLRRWKAQGAAVPARSDAAPGSKQRDEWDDRLDDELKAEDD